MAIKKHGTSEDVASFVSYLASEQAVVSPTPCTRLMADLAPEVSD
jgi:hypothetical protein